MKLTEETDMKIYKSLLVYGEWCYKLGLEKKVLLEDYCEEAALNIKEIVEGVLEEQGDTNV